MIPLEGTQVAVSINKSSMRSSKVMSVQSADITRNAVSDMVHFVTGLFFGLFASLMVMALLKVSSDKIYTKEEYDAMVRKKNDDIEFLFRELRALEYIQE